ncbi:hypothetical protein Pmar_PMAR017614 [Perkinsus marinus ATCC 50983]|uniref:Uncharacterized protein n=1 Tax=Perkinsus marinus (strain ATCC 50983 / TXsc) TaxID=423536 RepID=C5L3I2_PERM5|nr:hypothetical protein Pmar_PMAR017614 [Perkinsus marinus ATCC 50983]EER08561.1 hypothetical protein Pmar_PMAR017614 [Perkinsus marinus ATCC 50983]|eukprot:XP_002776745.1 hypothetical protein Pmar_PMAR017614 [Perkinsus marinus ATCC 50983]
MTKPEIHPSVRGAIEEALREVAAQRPMDPVGFIADRLAAETSLNVDDYAAAHREKIRAMRHEVNWSIPPGADPFVWVPVAYCDDNSIGDLRKRAEKLWKTMLDDPEHMIDRAALEEAYPELYYFRAVDDEEDEAALFDVLCQAITVILYVLTADQSIVRYYKPFDGVGDYRRTVGKFDEYAEDFSANFMRDGMGPREGAGKFYAMLAECPRFLSLFPSFKKHDLEHRLVITEDDWAVGFPLCDLPRGRFIPAQFEILREEALVPFPPLSLEIVVQALVAESIYDHWDGILPKFDPDFFCIEVQIAAEVKLSSKPEHFLTLRDIFNGKVLTEEQLVTLVTYLGKDGLSQRPVLLPEGFEEYFDASMSISQGGPCWALGVPASDTRCHMFADILGSAMKDFGKRHANECILIIDLHKLTGRIAASPEEYDPNAGPSILEDNNF